jgi:hypothetical protein
MPVSASCPKIPLAASATASARQSVPTRCVRASRPDSARAMATLDSKTPTPRAPQGLEDGSDDPELEALNQPLPVLRGMIQHESCCSIPMCG